MGHEDYIAFIVNAHRLYHEAKAPEREQHIQQACASYAAQNPDLMEEMYNSDGLASDSDASDNVFYFRSQMHVVPRPMGSEPFLLP